MRLQFEEAIKTFTFSIEGHKDFYLDIVLDERKGWASFYLYNSEYEVKSHLTEVEGKFTDMNALIVMAENYLKSNDYIGAYRDEYMSFY